MTRPPREKHLLGRPVAACDDAGSRRPRDARQSGHLRARGTFPRLSQIQGADDTTGAGIAESQALFNLLTAAGADTALHFVAGAGHGFTTPATAWPDAEATMCGFLVGHGIGQ